MGTSPLVDGLPPEADKAPPKPEADFTPLPSDPERPLAAVEDDPYHRDTLDAQKAFDEAVGAAESGAEEAAVRHYLRAAKIAEAAREWYLAALALRRVGDFLVNPKPPADLERALRMYQRAVAAYERCGLFHEARELSYKVLSTKLRLGRRLRMSPLHRTELYLFWLTAGFGWRPLRVVATAAAVVVLYGVLYWALGGAVAPDGCPVPGLADAVYFSGITFATVGYGDIVPAPHARMLALSEGALGAFLTGFFVVVLARRLSKG